jgi:hypothetical protein
VTELLPMRDGPDHLILPVKLGEVLVQSRRMKWLVIAGGGDDWFRHHVTLRTLDGAKTKTITLNALRHTYARLLSDGTLSRDLPEKAQ